MSDFFAFKRHAGQLEVSVDTDGSIEIDYISNARGYMSNDSRHYLAADEVKQIVAALPVAGVRVDDPPNDDLEEFLAAAAALTDTKETNG